MRPASACGSCSPRGRPRAQARELAARCRYVELSTRGDFQKAFLHNIGFKTKPQGGEHSDRFPGFDIG